MLSSLKFVLVEPQLGANIGMAARAMKNFHVSKLVVVAPREGWPNQEACAASVGAEDILEQADFYNDVRTSLNGSTLVFATTARERGQMKRVLHPEQAMIEAARHVAQGGECAVLFGRERNGLTNDEVSLADAIVTFPVNPAFPSLNLAQAVLLMSYEWLRASHRSVQQVEQGILSPVAPRGAVLAFFEALEGFLDQRGHYPQAKKEIMVRNMRDMILRMKPTIQDIRTLRGVLASFSRKNQ